jgi:hypothetical protein
MILSEVYVEMHAIIGTNGRMIKNLKVEGNNNEKSIQPHRNKIYIWLS